jgi:formylglycine-generating enzyme required for sulfatase activity
VDAAARDADASASEPDASSPKDANSPRTDAGSTCRTDLAGSALTLVKHDDGAFCIDAREATQRDYGQFLAAIDGETVAQPSGCELNERFEPVIPAPGGDTAPPGSCLGGGAFDPVAYAEYSMGCVDWCDASAFCSWAGKRLCSDLPHGSGRVDGGVAVDEWSYACTSAGNLTYPYGNEHAEDRCVEAGSPREFPDLLLTRGSEVCTGPETPFDEIRDLVGSLSEWTADCVDGTCAIRGGSLVTERASCAEPALATRFAPHPSIGFRCCADTVSE